MFAINIIQPKQHFPFGVLTTHPKHIAVTFKSVLYRVYPQHTGWLRNELIFWRTTTDILFTSIVRGLGQLSDRRISQTLGQ